MMKKTIFFIVLLLFIGTSAKAQSKQIEVFDISKGKVILQQETNPDIQKDVKKYVNGIKKIYSKIQPIPKAGLMVKVPLEPAIRVENQWLSAIIDEVIIIIPADDEPILMLFDDENRTLFFTFTGNVQELLKKINVK